MKTKTVRVNFRLTEKERERLRRIGGGDMTRGLRNLTDRRTLNKLDRAISHLWSEQRKIADKWLEDALKTWNERELRK